MRKIGENIKRLRKEKKMSQKTLAELLEVKPTSVSAWEVGRNEPLMNNIDKMSRIFQVPKSEIIGDEINKKAIQNMIIQTDNDTQNSDMVRLPIVGRISCGNGALAYQDIEGYEDTPRSWMNGGEYFYLRARGDSMINARIFDGDLLYIRKQNDIENGEIAAVNIDGEAYLKRVYKQNDSLVLQSENPQYPPIICAPGECSHIQIIGKLMKLVVKF
ncbi:TPA: LexA family protein [Bacillus paranthracis]